MFAVAFIDTAHYSFTALGRDEIEARETALAAYRLHCAQTGADLTYIGPDDVHVITGEPGEAFRDYQRIPTDFVPAAVGHEAICGKCGEAFCPGGPYDLIHLVRASDEKECGGIGRYLGGWR